MSPSYTLVGTPFSTFTRTIASALVFKGIQYEQKATAPHSELAYEHHPFGFIPCLVIKEDNRSLKLRESQAIIRYLDRIAPYPSLAVAGLEVPEKLWEFVSIIAAFGYKAVELQVVKIRVKSTDEGKESADECRAQIESSGGAEDLRTFFQHIESLREGKTPYLLGGNPTWPDFFLYPLVSDLLATPDADLAPAGIVAWAKAMESVKGINETLKGTLADGGRP
ncbi:hypothetical protein BDV93DRAFT_483951 [Ceratobasidium sp. AG-I]|nr:hypothetical protein BDV93DRAFT_483951 [Ceratobasidium sp. AG-I]